MYFDWIFLEGIMVPKAGIEPAHLAVLDFESSASTSSTTSACEGSFEEREFYKDNP